MNDFANNIAANKNVTQEKQIAAGEQVHTTLNTEYQQFLQELFRLLDSNEIDPYTPSSMLKNEVYDSLTEQKQDAIDMELHNICNQVRMIDNFRKSNNDQLDSAHFTTMVKHLWEMVNRIEIENDIFKF